MWVVEKGWGMACNETAGSKGACLAQHYRICWNSELSSVSGGSALSRERGFHFLLCGQQIGKG